MTPRAPAASPISPRAHVDSEDKGTLLTFDAPTMPIFPEKNQAYVREAAWGTLFKLYEYGTRAVTNMMLEDGLMMKLRLLLPEPALPIRFHECRDYAGHSGSFDTPMAGLIYTLEQDRKNPKRQNVEWFDKFDIDIEGQKFTVRTYLFRKHTKDETRTRQRITARTKASSLPITAKRRRCIRRISSAASGSSRTTCGTRCWCSSTAPPLVCGRTRQLFMANRENLRHGPLKWRLERELEDKLHQHKELEQIAIARRKGELSESPDVSETFEKFVEDMVKKHPLLEQILGPGFRIANPFKPHLVESRSRSHSKASASPPNSTSAAGRRARHSTATHI